MTHQQDPLPKKSSTITYYKTFSIAISRVKTGQEQSRVVAVDLFPNLAIVIKGPVIITGIA